MFLKFLKSKKSKKLEQKEVESCEDSCDGEMLRENENPPSSPVDMPSRTSMKSHGPTFSRIGQYSNSRASSHLSVSSGMTVSSASSVSSRTSNSSAKSSKSAYDIDRFKGAKNMPKKMKSMGYQDVWAQAYTFGGR